ncbi:MAG: hypothetical protein CXT78_03020 [Thaumarchaeota archaeon]|jgi:sialic acid synthase SpsE|nr:MAG: hypothetical protein CXT78_03020 [Nitrososphaerota archaeon]
MHIIAEIGVNWDGDFELAKQLMIMAKNAGCDSVKFQSFEEKMIKDHLQHERLIKSAISKKNISQIDQLSKSIGIEWFCTPMFPEAVEFLNPYVKKFKIRELDGRSILQNSSTPLFEKIMQTKKPILISAENSPRNSKFFDNPRIQWLYCVPKYPCALKELNFKNFTDFDGFSNHCNKIEGPIRAAKLGTKIIEVHITLDKTKPFLDNDVSFDYNELQELVKQVRKLKK